MKGAKKPKGQGRGRKPFASATAWVAAALFTLYLAWLICLPQYAGFVGRWVHEGLFEVLGLAAVGLPIFTARGLWSYFDNTHRYRRVLEGAGALISLVSAAALCSLLGDLTGFSAQSAGGIIGVHAKALLVSAFGEWTALALSALILLMGLKAVFELPLVQWVTGAFAALIDDYYSWQKSRKELALELSRSQAAAPTAVEPTVPAAPARPTPENSASSFKIKTPAAETASAVNGKAKPARPPAPGSPFANYVPPPLSLLKDPPPAHDRGRPLDSELAQAKTNLEQTLRNFGIEATVTGCFPGPVITRYELAPAPGVKVSSIVALENDIALALKAKGIRIVAPIPGKAAVGIEIPNSRPALVVLKEILQSAPLAKSAAPLSFAVGLSLEGGPVTANLQSMPHLLVAGATNSGKSVALHSLILSYLFRCRPDDVKLMLIDPKRLELTFYDAIPHLFDPLTAPENASVITDAKRAAKALDALVKIMEKRYEKFQLFGVRNIDSYNQEADRRGKPREFFIVVVIDELADLMLTARGSVEDAIQRLTQMARAVGIHLVLATQRPSVDVITGVIKANLPCRISLQVISKVDSKVILDSTGAESLQGRGDLLFLAAGAQRPERCQGAFVSEEEIKGVADYLRAQGKPDYPYAQTPAEKASEDLASYGVSPLEFSQALKLVVERKRVSQDLLKSQFGSSARATNLLSLLEVKGMINKPEGSNHWEIHFDLIRDYLKEHFPQVPVND